MKDKNHNIINMKNKQQLENKNRVTTREEIKGITSKELKERKE